MDWENKMLEIRKFVKAKKFHFWDSLNITRAGILGANDGIISVSGIVLGAAAANLSSYTLFISGVSGMLAGACSMAGGEYISVSAQKEVQLKRLNIQAAGQLSTKNLYQTKISELDVLNPIHAATASFLSFLCGAIIPLLAISLSNSRWRVTNTALAMIIALSINAIIGYNKAETPVYKAVIRNVAVGVFTTVATYLIGSLLGMTISA
ncbi:VIT1/CCC1 transporter family protein [Pediococcus inopinatus]|nr:VIT1/CCC1 transporter family protein [Pediococcus inopinatus]WPC20356.1 VIT1/CCC1 transporter family protein [Pediococcus inopinatus]